MQNVDAILKAFWLPFCSPNGAFRVVTFGSFLDSAKNGAPHENTGNNKQIEGRALPMKKNQYENEDEQLMHSHRFSLNF